jgi:uncharacterized protein YndB with AHSA1/START domain
MTATIKTNELTIETPSERELVMSRVFDAPRTLVFEAFTSTEHVPQWMLGPGGWTMTACEIDLRPGGSWRFAWRSTDGTAMELSGEYQVIDPPGRIVQTESWGEDWPETLNTLQLEEKDGRTTMTQTVAYPSEEARDAALRSGMDEGASLSFQRLADYLARLGR